MNIAILLGVSEYQNADNLPACKKDLETMTELIKATGKYDDILDISEDTDAANVKKIITSKINELKDSEIEEIFFYYTGHGDFYKDEFYYVLSDFDKKRRKQTSLENLEVDNWFRSLNPDTTIKIIDSCYAGVVYVKGNDQELEKYLRKSQGKFTKCYFMFSSNFDQSSYQDDNLSYFTKSFINAVKMHSANEIRYKDIIDYISDDFGSISSEQTPFFVTQADFTEKFCLINSNIKKVLASSKDEKAELKEEPELQMGNGSLESIIRKDAEYYFTKDQVFKLLEELETKIQEHVYPDEFTFIYDVNYSIGEHSNFDDLPNLDTVGKWLDENDNLYFAETKSRQVPIEVEPTGENAINNKLNLLISNYYTERMYKRVITGFRLTTECPYDLIRIEAYPNYPNVFRNDCIIAFVLSKTEFRFFYCFIPYKDINWDEIEMDEGEINWITKAVKFKDKKDMFNLISNIQNEFANFVMGNLNEKFGMKTKESIETS